MGLKEKIIFHVVGIGLLGLMGVCFARSQYYQGRIDARREMMVEFTRILTDTLNEKKEQFEETIEDVFNTLKEEA